jgi:hypothetical protein
MSDDRSKCHPSKNIVALVFSGDILIYRPPWRAPFLYCLDAGISYYHGTKAISTGHHASPKKTLSEDAGISYYHGTKAISTGHHASPKTTLSGCWNLVLPWDQGDQHWTSCITQDNIVWMLESCITHGTKAISTGQHTHHPRQHLQLNATILTQLSTHGENLQM